MQLKQYDKALSDLNYAISLEPTDIEHFNRANVYRELGEWQKALDDYELSLSLHNQPGSELHGFITQAISETKDKLNSHEQNTNQIDE
jgi:tetratricopeptide (TPR) repeat protein